MSSFFLLSDNSEKRLHFFLLIKNKFSLSRFGAETVTACRFYLWLWHSAHALRSLYPSVSVKVFITAVTDGRAEEDSHADCWSNRQQGTSDQQHTAHC